MPVHWRKNMAVQPKSKYRYHYDEMKEPFDLAVRDAGIHIWHGSLHKEILFDAATADKKIYWFEIPTYMLTSKIAASIKKSGFIFSDVKNFLRELKKLDAAGEIIFGRPYVCMFTAEDGGQAGTGLGAIVALYNHIQPSLSALPCGDGWGRSCLFAVCAP